MKVLTGVDIISIDRFKSELNARNTGLFERLFLPSELTRQKPEHLAGIFAAKEAVIKAFSMTEESWQRIEISHTPAGKPFVIFHTDALPEILSSDVSIAHEATVAIASFIALVV